MILGILIPPMTVQSPGDRRQLSHGTCRCICRRRVWSYTTPSMKMPLFPQCHASNILFNLSQKVSNSAVFTTESGTVSKVESNSLAPGRVLRYGPFKSQSRSRPAFLWFITVKENMTARNLKCRRALSWIFRLSSIQDWVPAIWM